MNKYVVIVFLSLFLYKVSAQSDTVKINSGEKSAESFFNEGVSLMQSKNYKDAINAFNSSIGLKADFDKSYYDRGLCYFELAQYEQAVLDFNNVISINLKFDLAYFSRAEVYFIQNKKEQAYTDYEKAIELNPSLALWIFRRVILKKPLSAILKQL